MIALLLALAWGCENPAERRVVGWSADGSQALLRIEHPDAEGNPHTLDLVLIDRYGAVREWPILELQDDSSAKIRGERWKKAEAELTAMGIAIAPDTQPVAGDANGESYLERDTIDLGWGSIAFSSASMNGSATRRYELLAVRGEQKVAVRDLLHVTNAGGSYSIGSVWTDPGKSHVVILPGFGVPAYHLVSREEIQAALDRPQPTCSGSIEQKVVGWSADRALVRVEQEPDTGPTCRLELVLLGSGEPTTYEILGPDDKGDEAVRSKRWAAAWAEIEALGVTLTDDLEPVIGETWSGDDHVGYPVEVGGQKIAVRGTRTDDRTKIRYELVRVAGREKHLIKALFELPDTGYPFQIASIWVDPTSGQAVFLPGEGHQAYVHYP